MVIWSDDKKTCSIGCVKINNGNPTEKMPLYITQTEVHFKYSKIKSNNHISIHNSNYSIT
ncbi:MAG: hypothetical protein WCH52_08630 [Bacteroidota bacterium]